MLRRCTNTFRKRKKKFQLLQKCWKTTKKNQDTASKKRKHYDDTACNIYLKLYDEYVFQNNQITYKIKQEQKQDLNKFQGV